MEAIERVAKQKRFAVTIDVPSATAIQRSFRIIFETTSDVADRMKDSIHTPIGRWTNRLAVATASLVCLAGCVGPGTQSSQRLAPSTPTPSSLPPLVTQPFTTSLNGGATDGVAHASHQQAMEAPSGTSGIATSGQEASSQVSLTSGSEPYVARQYPATGQPIAPVDSPTQTPSAYQLPPPPPAGTYAPPAGNYVPPPNSYTPPAGNYAPPPGSYTTPPNYAPPVGTGVPSGPTNQPGTAFGAPPSSIPESSLGNTGLVSPYAPVPSYAMTQGPTVREADLIINGYPARTGRIMLGGAVNSDAGVTGQLTIDERNFDITRWPRSFQDMFSGTAFRGAGQTFRLEAAPGSSFQRYTMQFADPNLLGYLPISMSLSGFLFDRRFNDWDEERLGGRLAFGYRITPDLSISTGISGQSVDITNPSTLDNPDLNAVLGDNTLWSGEVSLKHDTRDSPIQASKGHFAEFKYELFWGDYDYSRFELEWRQYWLLRQRADGSGKQTVSYSTRLGFTGSDTPIFENFFAGGYATLRGFEFRGASPVGPGDVEEGGEFQWLNSVEYMFPITADDAFRGVAFVDFGTVEQNIEINSDQFRVAPGLGLRVAIPMLGPAPLAFDFAYPVAKADTDQTRVFSFYMSLIR